MIRVSDLNVQIGDFSLSDISFEIPTGQYAVLMGKTGSGKTTLLEALCGLRRIRAGAILLDGEEVTGRKPAERGIGYVPQDGALFSTMTVNDHLAFPLRVRRWKSHDIEQRTRELSQLLGISELLHRLPEGLSGGETQRVALGRALAFRPKTLILDEPLSALDDESRKQMYELLKKVQQITGVTALHITHNIEEAIMLADRLFRLEDSRVFQTKLDGNGTACA